MNISAKYLDLLHKLTEAKTDYAVHKMLGVGKSRISAYRTGRNKFDEDMCFKVAKALGVDPMEVIAAIKLEQCYEKDEAEKAGFWSNTLKNTGKTLGMAFIALAVSSPKVQAEEFNITPVNASFLVSERNNNIHYAVSSIMLYQKNCLLNKNGVRAQLNLILTIYVRPERTL